MNIFSGIKYELQKMNKQYIFEKREILSQDIKYFKNKTLKKN